MQHMAGQVTVLMCQFAIATHGQTSDCANVPMHLCDTLAGLVTVLMCHCTNVTHWLAK